MSLVPFARSALAFAPALLAAAAAQAAPVVPPPQPPGAALVVVEPGLNAPERERAIRAHHHKGHVRKDFTRDDSMPERAGPAHGHMHDPAKALGLGAGSTPKGGK